LIAPLPPNFSLVMRKYAKLIEKHRFWLLLLTFLGLLLILSPAFTGTTENPATKLLAIRCGMLNGLVLTLLVFVSVKDRFLIGTFPAFGLLSSPFSLLSERGFALALCVSLTATSALLVALLVLELVETKLF